MKRSFNYTGRKKLTNDACEIVLWVSDGKKTDFSLRLNPEVEPDIEKDAVVLVEAYRGPKTQRFKMGTWGDSKTEDRIKLDQFQSGEAILFRLKVVDETKEFHPIRAWKDRITPLLAVDKKGKTRKCILPVESVDLENILWKLVWDELTPILRVNSRASQFRSITSIVENDVEWAALVFPDVFRQILEKVIVKLKDSPDEEIEDNDWIEFGKIHAGGPFPGIPEDQDEQDQDEDTELSKWIDAAIQNLGYDLDLVLKYAQYKA